MKTKKQNLRQCKNCKKRSRDYVLINGVSAFCDFKCATEYATQPKKIEQGRRKANRQARQAFNNNDRAWLTKQAQSKFNEFIRLRDKGQPCISCDAPDTGVQRDASHYRSVGACSYLRFNENNVWAACIPCNRHASGNLIEYRIRLVKKIGLEAVEKLENAPRLRRWTLDELREIYTTYQKKINNLQKS